MKQISIIIVNYNVKHFLEHCLLSVFRALGGIDAEIFVVDNQSTDGSVELVREKFPAVQLIANQENVGFAKANNQAVALSTAEYILYLNPDTIVAEDCFSKCLDYMNAYPDVGALGPKLIDGKGIFLPESKRGFPSAWVAFCKISGLSSLFKNSKRFNQYHQGFLPEDETNEVDVLVGCFMFCRKSVIDKVGSFDETYFMYGEDIDLSYQIKQGGFKNIYFPETTVIHYKGESTKKGSLNYVKMFYKAMIIFAKKNFTAGQKGLYVFLITAAIYFRAFVAFLRGIFTALSLPLLDAIILLGSQLGMLVVWKNYVKPDTEYSINLLIFFFSSYLLIWLVAIFSSGGYDRPYKPLRVLRGMLIGSFVILSIYALLPESYRFSRGITVLGALLGTLAILAVRFVLQKIGVKSVESEDQLNKKVIIVGNDEEEKEINFLLGKAGLKKNIIGTINSANKKSENQLATFEHLKPISELYNAGEIIFAQEQLSFKEIIDSITAMGSGYDYKIHSHGTDSIIGSNSKNTAGDLYTTELVYNIAMPASRRNKRVVDIIFSLCFILIGPFAISFTKNKSGYFSKLFGVLFGRKTFIGYYDNQFPKLKEHLLPTFTPPPNFEVPPENVEHLNYLYAKEYSPWTDAKLIWENWKNL